MTQLDLSHNFLRALTRDLVAGLSNLQSLDLTDNDISLVESSAVSGLTQLRRFPLTGKSFPPSSMFLPCL